MRLLPREEKFFHFFLNQAHLISQAAQLLADAARQGAPDAAEKITKLERDGDEIIHEVFRRLNATFITPLDPEDIHKLASSLDDVLDAIEEIGHKMVAYRITPVPPRAQEICGMILSSAKTMEKAFSALGDNEPVLDHCIEINRLEDQADQVGRAAVADLFATETDAIKVLKLKEFYDLLETAMDAAEDVADVLQNVVVKNS